MNKTVRRIFVALLIIAVLGVGVASYIGLNGMGLHRLAEMSEQGTVNFWYTNEKMTAYYNNVASVYNQTNRGANVVPKLVSASEYLEQIYKASIQGEEYPDVYVLTSDLMEKAYLAGLTMPVEEEETVKEHFPEVAIGAASYEDTLLGYPLYFDTSTLVYNKSILEQIALDQFKIQAEAEGVENTDQLEVPEEDIERLVQVMIPTSVDELINFSNNFEAPVGMESVFKWNINDVFFNYFYLGEYTTISSDQIDIYNESTAACMEIFKHVTEYFYMDAETVSTESVLQEFMEGKILFTILDSKSAEILETANKEGQISFNYDYSLIPDPGESLYGKPLSVTNVVVVNGYASHSYTANDFAQFLTMENYCSDQMYEKTGYIPCHTHAAVSGNMESMFRAEYEESVNMPSSMVTSNFWMLLENAFNEIWDGADAQEVLENLEIQLQNQIPE